MTPSHHERSQSPRENDGAPRTLGIVLAGGEGSRLGPGVTKAEVVVHGMTLRARALETIGGVCDEVVLVAPRSRASAATLEDSRWIEDAGLGPLSGIVAGFGAAPFDQALVLGVDFPLVRAPLLNALLAELRSSGATAVMSAPRGVPQPLVAAYALPAVDELQRAFAAGERSITRAMVALGAAIVGDDFIITHGGGLDELMNVNTPEELASAERALAERARCASASHVARGNHA